LEQGAERARAGPQVVDQVTKALYEQTMDAQEGVTDWLLDQMAAQHVKELLLAYYLLLLSGAPPPPPPAPPRARVGPPLPRMRAADHMHAIERVLNKPINDTGCRAGCRQRPCPRPADAAALAAPPAARRLAAPARANGARA